MELKEQQKNRTAALPERAGIAAVCCCLYAVWFGWLLSMGGLSASPLLSLLPGLAAQVVSSVLSKKNALCKIILLSALFIGLLCLMLDPRVTEGGKLYLNCLFAASEAQQRYRYDRFQVTLGTEAIPCFFLPLGLWMGAFFAWTSAGRRVLQALPFVALFLFSAWLGLTPGTPWMVATAALLLIIWILPENSRPFPARLLILLLCALPALGVLLFFPGSHAVLTAWEQDARDGLAWRTAAYDERSQELPHEEAPAPSEENRFEEIDPEPEPEGVGIWSRPLRITLFSLLILLLLFIPSVLSDCLKRKRTRNRTGLDDRDARVRVKAAFLYALRWLREAGLAAENCPFSAYLPELSNAAPELAECFEAVLPIWQTAAYSLHPVPDKSAEEMDRFLQLAKTLSLSRMTKKQRFTAVYLHAL